MAKKVTHVIFDIDGTLLDTQKYYAQALAEVCETHGKEYTKEVRMAHLGRPSDQTCQIVLEKLGITAKFDEFFKEYTMIAHSLMPDAELLPGVERLVRHLNDSKIPLAMSCSSSPEGFQLKFSKHRDFLKRFHHYVLTTDQEVKKAKPQPDVYLLAARRFSENPKPQDCLVFEDSPTGIQAATSAGMQCVMVDESGGLPLDMLKDATLVIHSMAVFKPEVFGLPCLV